LGKGIQGEITLAEIIFEVKRVLERGEETRQAVRKSNKKSAGTRENWLKSAGPV